MPKENHSSVPSGDVACQLIVRIERFLDEHQPGIVECSLVDAYGKKHFFIEKLPVVTAENLWRDSTYPAPGSIACQIEQEAQDDNGAALLLVNTEMPWGVESTMGITKFFVRPSQIQENCSTRRQK